MAQGVQKYTGCSLEVFKGIDSADLDYSKQVPLSGLVRIAKERGESHMVRRTLISSTVIATDISASGLDHYLARVDEAFTGAAAAVGGTVIAHEWGLVARTSAFRGNYYPAHLERFGIDDYLLAARVPLLKGAPTTVLAGRYYQTVYERLNAAEKEFAKEHGWFAYDTYKPNQFTVITQAGSDPLLVLHDIDPVTKDVCGDFK